MTSCCLYRLWQVAAPQLLLECNTGGVSYGSIQEFSSRVEPPLSTTLWEDPHHRLGGSRLTHLSYYKDTPYLTNQRVRFMQHLGYDKPYFRIHGLD